MARHLNTARAIFGQPDIFQMNKPDKGAYFKQAKSDHYDVLLDL